MEQFYTWTRVDNIGRAGNQFSGSECCAYFDKEFWFDLGKSMRSKHRSTFQYNEKYIYNDIMKPFRVSILQYDERVCKMHNLAKYTNRHFMKKQEYYDADWAVCDKEFSENEVLMQQGKTSNICAG